MSDPTLKLLQLFLTCTSSRVSHHEVGVMQNLVAAPRLVAELAADEGVSEAQTVVAVNRLEDRGWVTRIADPADDRTELVSLTADGGEVCKYLGG